MRAISQTPIAGAARSYREFPALLSERAMRAMTADAQSRARPAPTELVPSLWERAMRAMTACFSRAAVPTAARASR